MRADICAHIQKIFPFCRAVIESHSVYVEEEQEIIFIEKTNDVAYVKIFPREVFPSLEVVLDDYAAFVERWQRHISRECSGDVGQYQNVECILVAPRFPDVWVKRISLIGGVRWRLYEIRLIKDSHEQIAYMCEERYATSDMCAISDEHRKTKEVPLFAAQQGNNEHVLPLSVATEIATPPSTPQQLDEDDTTRALKTEVAPEIIKEETAPDNNVHERRDPESGQSGITDFFDRAQLHAQEEKEFLSLQKRLTEHAAHDQV